MNIKALTDFGMATSTRLDFKVCCLASVIYIARHNKAVVTIYEAFAEGKNGDGHTIMDPASRQDLWGSLTTGSQPNVLESERSNMRPDILIISGMRQTNGKDVSGVTNNGRGVPQEMKEK